MRRQLPDSPVRLFNFDWHGNMKDLKVRRYLCTLLLLTCTILTHECTLSTHTCRSAHYNVWQPPRQSIRSASHFTMVGARHSITWSVMHCDNSLQNIRLVLLIQT